MIKCRRREELLNKELMEGKIYLEAQEDIQFIIIEEESCCKEFTDCITALIPFTGFTESIKVLTLYLIVE